MILRILFLHSSLIRRQWWRGHEFVWHRTGVVPLWWIRFLRCKCLGHRSHSQQGSADQRNRRWWSYLPAVRENVVMGVTKMTQSYGYPLCSMWMRCCCQQLVMSAEMDVDDGRQQRSSSKRRGRNIKKKG